MPDVAYVTVGELLMFPYLIISLEPIVYTVAYLWPEPLYQTKLANDIDFVMLWATIAGVILLNGWIISWWLFTLRKVGAKPTMTIVAAQQELEYFDERWVMDEAFIQKKLEEMESEK
jgi:hypothetical protein